jgi:hypothetical protein
MPTTQTTAITTITSTTRFPCRRAEACRRPPAADAPAAGSTWSARLPRGRSGARGVREHGARSRHWRPATAPRPWSAPERDRCPPPGRPRRRKHAGAGAGAETGGPRRARLLAASDARARTRRGRIGTRREPAHAERCPPHIRPCPDRGRGRPGRARRRSGEARSPARAESARAGVVGSALQLLPVVRQPRAGGRGRLSAQERGGPRCSAWFQGASRRPKNRHSNEQLKADPPCQHGRRSILSRPPTRRPTRPSDGRALVWS